MNPLRLILSVFLIIVVVHSKGENTVTLNGHIVANGHQSHTVFVGVFELPMRPEAEAWSWTRVESTEFTLNVPDAKEIQLVALRNDSLPVVQRIQLGSADAQIELEFQEGLTLEGNILSTDGVPVANTWLILGRNDLPNVQIPVYTKPSWKSDANGRFKIGGLVANDSYEIEVSLQSGASETFPVKISEGNKHRELRLSNGYYVMGRVVDLDQDRIQEARVSFLVDEGEIDSIFHSQFGPNDWSPSTATDANGEFEIGPLQRDKELTLVARHEEKGSSRVLQVASGEHNVELVLAGMVRVVGSVLDAATGEPIDDFTMFAVRGDGSRKYSYADSKGEVSSMVDPKTVGFIVDSSEYSVHFRTGVTLESVNEYDLGEIALNRSRQLTGQVYDAGTREPVVGATVSHSASRLTEYVGTYWDRLIGDYLGETAHSATNENGEYLLKGVSGDSTQLEVSADDYQDQRHQIDGGTTVFDVALVKKKSASSRVSGRIESLAGDPLAGEVYFATESGASVARAQSDGLFDHVLSPNKYKVIAITDHGVSNVEIVDVVEDEIQEVTLVVDSRGRLTVSIKGLWDGEIVQLNISSEASGVGVRSMERNGNGEVVVTELGIGEFRIRAWSNRERTQVKSIQVSASSEEAFVQFNFSGNSRIFGSLTMPNGSVGSGRLFATPKQLGKTGGTGAINTDGTYEIKGLDDGEYTVYVQRLVRLSLSLEDRGWSGGGTVRVGQFDVLIRGDTQRDVQLPTKSDSE
ncbi:MAG: carboxypeptidase regulatory-like domain-containing protein [Gammaproteobacteria bacterium]|nr:carboxypeptidase regulatory-like domain-containing protein [Gammaproteobacteria bacterium]MYD80812.1 carboxypeptidase regulatory-like domain-containing protein [Gammaproteobacteria bacterium]